MRFTRALMPLALAGVLLAGCGNQDGGGGTDGGGTPGGAPASAAPTDNGVAALDPKAIVDKAVGALGSAKSFTLKGDITTDSQKIGLDVKVSGSDVLGTMTLDGARVELLRVGGQMFIRPDEKFWTQTVGDAGATMVQLMGDKWAKLSSKDADFQEFFQIAEPAELLKPEGTLSKGATKTVNGVEAIGIVEAGADGGTLYVATTGEPYPVLVEGPAGQGQLAFGDFGATFDDIKAPAAADVIDLDKLMGK